MEEILLKDHIKNCLVQMLDDGEFDKIQEHLSVNTKKEHKRVENDKKIAQAIKDNGNDNVSIILVIHKLQSIDVIKDLLCYLDRKDIHIFDYLTKEKEEEKK